MGKCLFLSLELLFPIFLFVDRQALCISLLGSFSQLIFILNRHLVQTFPTFDIFCLACFPLTLVFIEELFQYIKPYSLTMSCKF